MRTLRTIGRIAIVLALCLAMVGAAFLVTAPPARADHNTIPWSGPVTVAASANFLYGYSDVVADGHGAIYVFYSVTNQIGSVTNLNVTKYKAVGSGGLPEKVFETQVNDVANVVSGGDQPTAAIGPNGNLYVAWTRDTTPSTVWVSTSTNGGVSWQPAKQASSPTSGGSNSWPRIAVGSDGTVWVVSWQSWTGFSYSVSKSTDSGATFGGWTNATRSPSLSLPAFAEDAGGRLYLVGIAGIGGKYYVNATWSDNGVTWASPQTLNNPAVYALLPSIVADSSGNVHVAWYSAYSFSQYEMRYSRSSDRGATWSGAMPITGPFGGGYIGFFAAEGDTVMLTWGDFDSTGIGFVISADHGVTWYPDESQTTGAAVFDSVAADQNGTFWISGNDGSAHLTLRAWYGPPSMPVISSVAPSGPDGLTVTWTPSPEQNVVDYQIWRSTDGTTYNAVGLVSGTATTFTDSGLANGSYYYKVVAINVYGTPSHDSAVVAGTVGPTTQQLINQLENEITALQNQLSQSDANLTAARAQITSLQTALTNLQNSQSTSDAATAAALARLQANITALQNQLNNLQSQQATQTISYANLAFEVIVVVLLVVLLLNQMRKPKAPQMMMAESAQTPKKPEDDL